MRLRAKTKADTKTIEDLSRERVVLTRKFKDRVEEMRGKTKLLDVWMSWFSFRIWLMRFRMYTMRLSR